MQSQSTSDNKLRSLRHRRCLCFVRRLHSYHPGGQLEQTSLPGTFPWLEPWLLLRSITPLLQSIKSWRVINERAPHPHPLIQSPFPILHRQSTPPPIPNKVSEM